MRRGIAVSIAVLAGAFAPSAAAQSFEVGELPACTQAVPAVVNLGRPATGLDVRVLLDGVTVSRAQQVVATAQEAYTRENITLRPTYEAVAFTGLEGQALIDQAKTRYGGSRPGGGIDLVYVLTAKDIQNGGDPGLAGLADCIGGIAHADTAFAVGEEFPTPATTFGPLTLYADVTAKTMAHEIGHLLGAHHHYANCAESAPPAISKGEAAPCTLMFNYVDLQIGQFSGLNGLVVRGHAARFAV